MILMMIMMMILMMTMMTKPYDYADDTDDYNENDHKNDSYTAAGAGRLVLAPWSGLLGPGSLVLALWSGLFAQCWLLAAGLVLDGSSPLPGGGCRLPGQFLTVPPLCPVPLLAIGLGLVLLMVPSLYPVPAAGYRLLAWPGLAWNWVQPIA